MRVILVLVWALLVCQVGTLQAQHWSTFQNGGAVNQPGKLATKWSPESGIAWQKKLAGYGQSSPVVFKNTIFVTSVTGPNKEKINVEALSVTDGSRKWIYSHANSTPQENTVMISRAAPTPACDELGVIAMFGGGNLLALDHEGQLRWQRDFADEYGDVKARHGLAASLEQNDDLVFVWVERTEKPYIVAIDKTNGQTAWKVDGVGGTSWGSPRLIAIGNTKHLVLSASGKLVGLNPKSGERLWEFDDIAGNTSVTPIPLGSGALLIGSTGSREGTPVKPCSGVLEVKAEENGYDVSWRWSSKKLTCSFGSPLVFDRRAYFVNRTGIVNCHDLDSGEKVYTGRITGGQMWATPLAANNLLYFFGNSGVTTIVQPADELKIISKNQLWELEAKDDQSPNSFSGLVLYAAIISGERLLLRRGDKVFAVTAEN